MYTIYHVTFSNDGVMYCVEDQSTNKYFNPNTREWDDKATHCWKKNLTNLLERFGSKLGGIPAKMEFVSI